MVTKTYLPTYLCDSSDNCDSNDGSDSSEEIKNKQKTLFNKNFFFYKKLQM